jgi:type II secretory pathway pseudopilin PulG
MLIRLPRALRRRLDALRTDSSDRSEKGLTLVELLVAMGLATIVGSMTLLLFVSANSSVNATTDRLTGSSGARVVLQSWQALMQTADTAPATNGSLQATGACPTGSTAHRFEWLTSTETLFYADQGNRSGTGTTCTPPTLVWLGIRNKQLVEAVYPLATGATAFTLGSCHLLTDAATAPVTAGSLFTPNPGHVLFSVDYGAAFAAASAFANVTGCGNMPTSLVIASVLNTDPTANNALSQMTTVGIDFTIADRTGAHTQTFDTTVPVLGGVSS